MIQQADAALQSVTEPRCGYSAADFKVSPLIAFYEVTRACNLLCKHCRAEAQPRRHPLELHTGVSLRLLDTLAGFPKPPMLVLTGGDPIKRPDIFDLVEHAVGLGLKTAMTPSATKLVTTEAVARLKTVGLHRLAVSLDGASAERHDSFRGVPGSFQRTLEIMRDARAAHLPMQINTTISRHNFDQIDTMAHLLVAHGIVMWSVFFLVPTGRGLAEQRIAPWEYEVAFEKLHAHSLIQPYQIKTTEAPHFRRFMLERSGWKPGRENKERRQTIPGMVGTNDGRGVMFISHIGEIYPSGFMPILCGTFPKDSPVDVYQNSPLFKSLRDPNQIKGKCGFCQYREICGGSRARAYALTGDPLESEPDCVHVSLRSTRSGALC